MPLAYQDSLTAPRIAGTPSVSDIPSEALRTLLSICPQSQGGAGRMCCGFCMTTGPPDQLDLTEVGFKVPGGDRHSQESVKRFVEVG